MHYSQPAGVVRRTPCSTETTALRNAYGVRVLLAERTATRGPGRLEVGRDPFVLHGRHSIRCDSEGGKGPGRRSGVPAARAGLRRHVHSDRPRIGAADRELRDQLQSGSAHARRPPRRRSFLPCRRPELSRAPQPSVDVCWAERRIGEEPGA
ncbi:hypothetical protein WR25_08487 [Diploscapter pachys]|uniref:Uncharacterized protein n=1 Tax=Diploscapter pachys TaxID=2018661 RepID=A0A2A2M538_9BILA|nr:hypothetical protein WR25_08487 [Diploscapter pachys]